MRIEAPPTRRELERRMAALLRDAGIDAPRINTIVDVAGERHEVDFLWLAEALVVETDGFATHGTRRQFERDRARDAHLQRHGYLVQRFSWRQVVHDPAKVAGVVRDLLVARRSQEFGQPHRTSRGCRLPAAAPD